MTPPELVEERRAHGGWVRVFQHQSETLGLPARYGVFLPPAASSGPVPVLWFLSGLTCSEQNFLTKAGLAPLAREGVAAVVPDTSPRGAGVEGEDASYDLGTGAGFYLDATAPPWATHYKMESYLIDELPGVVGGHLPLDMTRQGITGHSMGGHGALTLALRHPGRFRSVSAFAPICAPTRCPWGEKAFTAYLGEDRASWARHDACELVRTAPLDVPLLVDQGTADEFLEGQLHPHLLREACEASGQTLELRMQEGYDHSYYFIASFLGDHVRHHAAALKGAA